MVVQDPLELSHNTLGHVQPAATRGRLSEEVIRAAVCILSEPRWTVRDLLPDPLPYRPAPGPQLPLPRVCFTLQAARLPLLFGRFGGAPEVEAQWHQWVVELACRVLRVLDIHYQISEGYDPTQEDLFPEVRTPRPDGASGGQDEGQTHTAPDARSPADTEPGPRSLANMGQDNTSKDAALDGIDPDPEEDKCVMDVDEEASTSEPPRRGIKRSLDPANISWQCRHKKRLVDPFRGRAVYRHERLDFSVEKLAKEETLLECCALHTGWVRGSESEDRLDPAQYSNLFSFEEALTKSVLQSRTPDKRFRKHRLFFVVKIRRFSYGHNSYIELEVHEHNSILPNVYFDSLTAHFQKLINSCIHAS